MTLETSINCDSNMVYCLISGADLHLGFAQGTGLGAPLLAATVIAVVALTDRRLSLANLIRWIATMKPKRYICSLALVVFCAGFNALRPSICRHGKLGLKPNL
jgi:hypothetical protein